MNKQFDTYLKIISEEIKSMTPEELFNSVKGLKNKEFVKLMKEGHDFLMSELENNSTKKTKTTFSSLVMALNKSGSQEWVSHFDSTKHDFLWFEMEEIEAMNDDLFALAA